ncbi:MAG: hypothetical protein AAF732_16660 [Pseudomonadota bacterium]
MNMRWVLAVTALALWAGSLVERARADETFVCENGKVITIQAGQRARLSGAKPCTAGWVKTLTAAHIMPLPAVHPRRQPLAPPRPVPVAVKAEPPAPEQPSNYRRVQVINAASLATRWFHHRH